ncbi:TetR/AcrR family transcriptional regulator [Saccharopolyspora phatthalungensis]|uniref:AcrR family transcriptional regulator n=1 Tax=Saccharopolyspora phatthalungensis TaxID=664693 RepID=A0A840QJV8_9PSEU|nr:TetR/AcrR family transcriptional regulator [Saccharopolyspora phatthalungensis]MBB5158343.1 AcrR family transcriptional regulator [Saccharopolyspora phatthalungensis]
MAERMSGAERRTQVLTIAAEEFAAHGLHGASTEAIARDAGITQAYIFRMFGTKKALFLELVRAAFERFSDGMRDAGEGRTGLDALSAMGAQYFGLLADRTGLLLQLQGFAACGDPEVRDAVRACFARMWGTAEDGTGLEPVTVKTFLAFGMLLNAGAAMDIEQINAAWADGVRTRIQSGLFAHITTEANR